MDHPTNEVQSHLSQEVCKQLDEALVKAQESHNEENDLLSNIVHVLRTSPDKD